MNDYAATGAPKFVMVGAQLAPDRCRLYASRDLPPGATAWGLHDKGYGPTAWHIETDLPYCLIVTEPTWGQAFGKVFEIWENHDRSRALEEARHRELEDSRVRIGTAKRNALAAGTSRDQPGHGATGKGDG